MELVPWRPFQEVGNLRWEMDEMWKRFFGENVANRFRSGKWMPSMDITEKEDHILVTVELPGFEPGDIDVRVTGDLLTLRGEKSKEEIGPEEHYCCREINSRTFHRSFRLPADVEGEMVKAVFRNGVLRMSLPKTTADEKKKVRINIRT
ncbi:MAG: molecular chaperone [Deltaproteobacteria bacterium HGW-Deltaproteobacteria-15]|jgi:HSP20 family protein|nr:MAG: molecular chaperone [Deltaproteobacteria bacterium HGW-Deltaproteobacteria-15]